MNLLEARDLASQAVPLSRMIGHHKLPPPYVPRVDPVRYAWKLLNPAAPFPPALMSRIESLDERE